MTASSAAFGDPVVTGEAVVLELRPAGIGSRGLALLLDFAVQAVIAVVLVLVASASELHMDDAAAAAVVLVLYVVLVLGYPVGFETLAHGRTPGKMALGLRVVRDDGGPIRFRHALVRGLVGVVLDRPGIFLGLLALGPMLFSARSKRLGDFAAGTVVLQERVPARVPEPPAMPPQLASWASALDLSGVTDQLALAVRQFLGRAGQLSPWAREEMGRQLAAELTRRTGAAPPPGTPGWAYLSAVLAERRRRELDRQRPAQHPARPPAVIRPTDPPTDPPAAGPFAPPG